MQIRRAEIKDIERISAMLAQVNLIHHQGRPDLFKRGVKYDDVQLKTMLQDDNNPIFVSVDDLDCAVGYVFCVMQRHKSDPIFTDMQTLYVDDLCVDETCRGKNIGTELLQFVFAYAKKIGCHNVTLNVWCLNQNALDFYTANGMLPMKIYMERVLD